MKLKYVSCARDNCVRGSVYKVSTVAALITGRDVVSAVRVLQHCHRNVASEMKKVLNAAIANAQNNHGFSDVVNLYVGRVDVGRAFGLRRFRARARGRGARIVKHRSRISIALVDKVAHQIEGGKNG